MFLTGLKNNKQFGHTYFSEDPPVNSGAGAGDPPANDDKGNKATFTPEQQMHINHLLAEEKKASQKTAQSAIEELTLLRTKQNMTATEREEQAKRITKLENDLLSKEDLAKKESNKLKTDYEAQIQTLTTQATTYQQKYVDSTIRRSLVDAAVNHKAYNPGQVLAILMPATSLNDKDEVVVTVKDMTEDGKPIVLEMTPEAAVKHLAEKEEFFNLFLTKGAAGLGGTTGNGKAIDLAELAKDPVKYRQAKKEGKI